MNTRRRRATGRLGLLVAAFCAAGSAHGAGADPTPFLGDWVFQDGTITLVCVPLTFSTNGIKVAIRRGTGADLEFDMGCDCRLSMNVMADGTAELAGAQQECGLVRDGQSVKGLIDDLSLVASSSGLTMSLGGSAALSGRVACDPTPDSVLGAGALARSGTPTVECGDDDIALGVMAYGPEGPTECPLGAGMEEVEFIMSCERSPPCTADRGTAHEGFWALPDDTRERRVVCNPDPNSAPLSYLRFCRVDGALFHPMTSGDDPSQYYAALKLGQHCPPGSVDITKVIDNEDDSLLASLTFGRAGQNTTVNVPGFTDTTLHFCYFQQGAAPMAAFPDVGLHYAVFHRYAGEQPPWVIAKSWQYSDDEDGGSMNQYMPPSSSPVTQEFMQVIENTGNDTYFDIAWVR